LLFTEVKTLTFNTQYAIIKLLMHKTEKAPSNVISLDAARSVKSNFVDFRNFQGKSEIRKRTKKEFVGGTIWDPQFDYPKLDTLIDEPKGEDELAILDKKAFIHNAIIYLEEAADRGEITQEEAELYAGFHEVRLKRILLVEAAARLRHEGSSSETEINRASFAQLNEMLFGEYDRQTYAGMMSTEASRLDDFAPGNFRAEEIKEELSEYFWDKPRTHEERELMDLETLRELGDELRTRYADVLAVIPDTDDSVTYDTKQCVEIMRLAMDAGGLLEAGWVVKEDSDKANPSTDSETKIIALPSGMKRTARELRRLILHEQEVHARRGENGDQTGISILALGTAEYADVEEGAGVLFECALEGSFDNQSYHRARDRYIAVGLALGVDGPPRDARQTYEILWRMLAVRGSKDGVIDDAVEADAKKWAMTHTENIFRGTNFAMPGTIYWKAKVYYEGLQKNADYFMRRRGNIGAAIDTMTIGKINHTDETEVEQVNTLRAAA
jgi:hypothetical protein